MPFNNTSYVMGYEDGRNKGRQEAAGTVILEEGDYDFTDENNDGHVVITKREGGD